MTMQSILSRHGSLPDSIRTREPLSFQHALADDPLLDLESVALLAESLGDDWVTIDAAVKPLVVGEGADEPSRANEAAKQIRELDKNNAWLTLLNIERNPRYRALIDEVIDATAVQSGEKPKSWRNRKGFIFASSPNSITPAHFDIEHSFCMQLRGNRTLGFGQWIDDENRDREVSRYWNGSFGRLASMPKPTREVSLGPGDGAYIPPYTPHWLTNGDSTSLSITLTFFTRSNEDESLVQVFNERLRKLGRLPRTYGDSPTRDSAKAASMRAYSAVRRRVWPDRTVPTAR